MNVERCRQAVPPSPARSSSVPAPSTRRRTPPSVSILGCAPESRGSKLFRCSCVTLDKAMRFRTSAAVALVTALLASPVAALACGFDCSSASSPVATVEAVEAPPAEGACHRGLEAPADGRFTLGATPHDCSSHSALDTGLTQPKSLNESLTVVMSTATLPSAVRCALSAAPSRVSPSPAHDLAPPGRTPDFIAPLRV